MSIANKYFHCRHRHHHYFIVISVVLSNNTFIGRSADLTIF